MYPTKIVVVERHDELIHLIDPIPRISEELAIEATFTSLKQEKELEGVCVEILPSSSSSSNSKNSTTTTTTPPCLLTWEDVTVEKLLGIGGFNCVSLVRIPKLEQVQQQVQEKESLLKHNKENAKCSGSFSWNNKKQQQQRKQQKRYYALKCLNKSVYNNRDKFLRGVGDLTKEGILLSKLQHPNIVELYGTTAMTTQQQQQQQQQSSSSHTNNNNMIWREPGGHFLVLQCMTQTLDTMLQSWEEQVKISSTGRRRRRRGGSIDKQQQHNLIIPTISYRMSHIALGIAKAMDYLQSKRIIYRDLKPRNIGIDHHGVVRLFDFGIAIQLLPHTLPDDDDTSTTVKNNDIISGCIGSLRYMPPEVLLQQQSQLEKSDAYSFGILLWYLLTLQKPYTTSNKKKLGKGKGKGKNVVINTIQQYKELIGYQNYRPGSIPKGSNISQPLRHWIKHSWNNIPTNRPSFYEICQELETYSSSIPSSEVVVEEEEKRRTRTVPRRSQSRPKTTITRQPKSMKTNSSQGGVGKDRSSWSLLSPPVTSSSSQQQQKQQQQQRGMLSLLHPTSGCIFL